MNHSDNSSNHTPSNSKDRRTAGKRKGSSRKKRNLLLTIGLTVMAVLLAAGFALSAYLNRPPELIPPDNGTTGLESQDTPAEPVKEYKSDFYTFIVAGLDKGGYHTDTLMVITLDTAAKKANIVSVPRDTQVDVPRKTKKINTAYTVGGVEELKKELESILGFSPQHHAIVDLEAFAKLVNAVGGVEFDVPQDMDMDDPTQNLHIHLRKGRQILNGDKALQLVRFRGYPSADIGRMETQQKFLKALAKKLLKTSNIPKIGKFMDIFQQDVKTDLSLRDLQWFARQAMELNPETDITVQTLPYIKDGNYQGQNYVYLAPAEVVSLVNRTINPYTTDITLEDVKIIRLED